MLVKKSDMVAKLEEELKRAKAKERENLKRVNNKAMDLIINALSKNENFKNEFNELLKRHDLKEVLKTLKEVYDFRD